ncbi:MAG: acetyltransferase [Labilithrix sp.]|nr:acetyltransferase [Labilithrix sp.]MCW5814717.1 acetyltransferase [Labilithrix sp.]
MSPLLVIGAAGHGRVIADIFRARGEKVDAFLDDDPEMKGRTVDGLEVIGPSRLLAESPARVALGIGHSPIRERIARECLELGCTLVTAIHPSAVVAPNVTIGAGTVVMALAVVNVAARLGRGVVVNTGAIVEHECVVGDFAHVSPRATLGGKCRLAELAQLGIGATMLPMTSVGPRSVIGGGALVARDIPADVVATGVPARVRRSLL